MNVTSHVSLHPPLTKSVKPAAKKRAATYAKQSETKENKDKDGKKEQ